MNNKYIPKNELKNYIDTYILKKKKYGNYAAKSISATETALFDFNKFMVESEKNLIDEDSVLIYSKSRSSKLSGQTILTYLGEVKRLYKWLGESYNFSNVAYFVKSYIVKKNDFKKPFSSQQINLLRLFYEKEISRYKNSEKEKRKLLNSIRDYAMFEFALRTGLRQMVLVESLKSDFFVKDSIRYLRYREKGSRIKSDTIPIPSKVVDILNRYWDSLPYQSDFVFNSHKKIKEGKPINGSFIRLAFRQAVLLSGILNDCKESDMKNVFTFHSLRYTFSTIVSQELGENVAQEYLNHKNITSTRAYNKEYRYSLVSENFKKIEGIFES